MSYTNEPYGIPFSGERNADVTGSLDVELYPNGYGEVYGIYWNTDANISYGLSEHSLLNLQKPSESGSIYWPEVLPFGENIVLKFSGISYYDEYSDTIIFDESGVINLKNGALTNLKIKPLEKDSETVIQTGVMSGDCLPFIRGEYLTGRNQGIFLTKDRFNRVKNFDYSSSPPDQQSVSGLLRSMDIQNPLITGYIAYASGEGMQRFDGGANFADHMNGGILNNDISRTDFYLSPFSVNVGQDYFILDTGDVYRTTGWRVTGFFKDENERRSNLDKLLTISPNKQPNYVVFFTGFESGTTDPLYLTYVSGNSGSLITCITDGTGYIENYPNHGQIVNFTGYGVGTWMEGYPHYYPYYYIPSLGDWDFGTYSMYLKGYRCEDNTQWVEVDPSEITWTWSANMTENIVVANCPTMPLDGCGYGALPNVDLTFIGGESTVDIRLYDTGLYFFGGGNIKWDVTGTAYYQGISYNTSFKINLELGVTGVI